MKKQYTAPNAKVIVIESKDVLTSSVNSWGMKNADLGNVEDL